jgi:hypothetical protein
MKDGFFPSYFHLYSFLMFKLSTVMPRAPEGEVVIFYEQSVPHPPFLVKEMLAL